MLSLLLLLMLAGAQVALAFPTQDDQSPGTLASGFKKRRAVWARSDVGVMDGIITTTPPDSKNYDRRIEVLANVGGEAMLSTRFAARLNVKADAVKRRVTSEDVHSPVLDETSVVYHPAFDLTFITDKGLELFGGVEGHVYTSSNREESSANGKTKATFAPVNILARRFGVTRHAGSWNGGFYYVTGAEGERTVHTSVFDGSTSEAKDIVFVPSRFGIFGDFNAGARWDFDLAFLQARGKGSKDEKGVTAYADYFEAKFGGLVMFGNLGMKAGVFHKTLSYANNAFVTLETIPMTSLKMLLLLGSADQHAFAGVIVGQGRDGQSLPEFNAKYESLGYAVTVGCQTPL